MRGRRDSPPSSYPAVLLLSADADDREAADGLAFAMRQVGLVVEE